MWNMKNVVMFVPACGLGTRVAERGPKPFIEVDFPYAEMMALHRVTSMAPSGMDVEIALPARLGCPPMLWDTKVYLIDKQTKGQAETISLWLEKTVPRKWVLISNCDNAIDNVSIEEAAALIRHHGSFMRGIVFTFWPMEKGDKRFSYCLVDPVTCRINQIVEKEAISQHACAGVYLLRVADLRAALRPTDIYLSEALARMPSLYAFRAKKYEGWNDMQQLAELEQGEKQSL